MSTLKEYLIRLENFNEFRERYFKELPETLFKYRDFKWSKTDDGKEYQFSVKSVLESTVRATRLDSLNDVFEGKIKRDFIDDIEDLEKIQINKGIFIPTEEKQKYEEAKKILINESVLCLSNDNKNHVLWAHYSDEYRGFCIEYDWKELISSDNIQSNMIMLNKVIYDDSPGNPLETLKGKNEFQKTYLLNYVKPKKWNYEDEYRLSFHKSGSYKHNPNAIKSIYFGVRAEDFEIDKFINEIRLIKEYGHVNFYKMKLPKYKYEIEYELIDK